MYLERNGEWIERDTAEPWVTKGWVVKTQAERDAYVAAQQAAADAAAAAVAAEVAAAAAEAAAMQAAIDELGLTTNQIANIQAYFDADVDTLFSGMTANQRAFLKMQHALVKALAKREIKEVR